ncbi:hypothetical protein PC129_g18001 [Phytophthora cactorum]|uniref:Uncharacterized protein n=1 Tax=Phytophthora cactorum TaxID=29920 RepID=A0A8T1JV49_9STRA|nr:hypothetical protein Pcac1_g4296 [Phytophthora cactorum]KAG2983447.1 hypothetical protein PC119_g20598 [Phytophthora cactorum]KAG3089057.1 hypothetical protein PC122_g8071 [Phytophthora cactorum]KAG3211013.1 hypothetical protein PC129_g18001 [Phytophthora cactorum]KAG4227380.1 hypothetical protein PC116_g24220 [Phytophthora cactorum]
MGLCGSGPPPQPREAPPQPGAGRFPAQDQNGGGVRYPDALQKKLSIRPFNGK